MPVSAAATKGGYGIKIVALLLPKKLNPNTTNRHRLQWTPSKKQLLWLAGVLSFLLGAWVNYKSHGVVNNDGILYLEAARLFDSGHWKQGLAIYNWPLYSLLIMLVHKISGLSFLVSANVLAVLSFGLTALGILVLIRETGGGAKVMLAGLVLLFSGSYLVGDILPMVVREHGYWAAYVWSVVFFVRFLDTCSWRYAFFWGACGLVAVLFRIEGLVFFALLPAVVLFDPVLPLSLRIRKLLIAHVVGIILAAVLVLLLLFYPTLEIEDMGRLADPWTTVQLVYEQLSYGIAHRAEFVARALGSYLDDFALPTLLLGMGWILIAKAATVGGMVSTVLALGFLGKTRRTLSDEHFRLFSWLLFLGFVTAAVILFKGFILPKRILSPIAFVMIVLGAYGLAFLWERARDGSGKSNRWRWVLGAVAFVLAIQILIVLRPASAEKSFEKAAVAWAASNIPAGSNVFYQSNRLMFYAGLPMRRELDWATVQQNAWKKSLNADSSDEQIAMRDLLADPRLQSYDYYIFVPSLRERAMLQARFGTPIQTFRGPRGKLALIFKNPAKS